MDNNDSMKPQQTGGLKLMTVFIAVLALHVLVIGGFTVYHLMGSGSSDADLTLDKTHKLKAVGTAMTDTTAPDAASSDKSTDATASTPAGSTDTASTSTTTPSAPAPAADATATTSTDSNPPVTPANLPVAPAPIENIPATPANPAAATTPLVISSEDMAQTPAIAPGLLPPPDSTQSSGVTIGAPAPSPAPAPVPAAPVVASVTPTPTPMVTPVPAPVPAPEPVPPSTPEVAPVPDIASATSGPIMPDNTVASGPVHMPATAPKPAATETAPSEEHAAMHEMKREIYTVKITDSYKKIAHAHHITVAQLKEANHITNNVLHTGQKLIIPIEKTSIARTDASPEIGTPSRAVLSDTSSMASLSASPTPGAEHHHHYYTVTKGDTLKYIARKFDVSVAAIKEANDLSGTKLRVGEKLRIPSKEARSAGTTVPTPAQPSQVETQPAPIAPVAQPAPVAPLAPQPSPASSPELANMTF
jgi:LysM repeat protein